ncbi:MAG: hypothetical protein R6X18_16320 [Chloroflexota bacterium]|jgi:hypothetical protein
MPEPQKELSAFRLPEIWDSCGFSIRTGGAKWAGVEFIAIVLARTDKPALIFAGHPENVYGF